MTAAKTRSAARCLPPACVADLSRAPQQLARVLNLVARGGRITKFLHDNIRVLCPAQGRRVINVVYADVLRVGEARL